MRVNVERCVKAKMLVSSALVIIPEIFYEILINGIKKKNIKINGYDGKKFYEINKSINQ